LKERRIETDMLCIGGGVVGLMAAIRASECGSRVLEAEKANTFYSGFGGLGNDHFMCYLHEIHGPDIQPIIDKFHNPCVLACPDEGAIKLRIALPLMILLKEKIGPE